MKKVYLFSLSIFAAGVLNAQQATNMENYPMLPALNETVQNNVRPTQSQNRAGGDLIITNDFSNAADWTTPADAGGYSWTIQNTTPANIDQYMGAMESATMSNGYALFAGIDLLLATPFTTQQAYLELNQTIDCSGNPGVILEFDQRYRAFNSDETIVEVSSDGGTVWTQYLINDAIATNATATQNTISLNVSASAAGNANVKVRFLWTGTDDQQFGAGYGWMIDDLKVYEAYNDNLVQEDFYLANIVTAYEYTKMPVSQATNLTVQSALYNAGLNTPTAVVNHVVVTDASGNVELDASGGTLSGPLASGDRDTLTFVTTLDMSTLALGVYRVINTIEFSVTDEDLSNNTDTNYFEITENTYSHYTTLNDGFLTNPGRNNTTTYDESTFGAMFEIQNNVTLHGLNVYIADVGATSTNLHTTTDHIIRVSIFKNTADFAAPDQLASYSFDMDGMLINDWNTLNLHQTDASSNNTGSFPLEGGESYRVSITSNEGSVLWTLANQPDSDNSGVQLTTAWFSLQSEPALELNFDQTLTINDNNELSNLNVSQNVPNPFTEQTIVSYNLNETANVSLQIMDVTGKVISTINEGTQAAGAHNISVDGAALAAGTYFYTLTAGTYQVTKRMVVSK